MLREKSEKLLNLYLENLETGIKALELMIPVVEKFNGKVYNARFDNAITKVLEEHENELGQRLWTHIELDLSNFKMELHFTKRCLHGKDCNEYLPSSYDEKRLYIYSKFSRWGDSQENKNYHDPALEGDEYYFYIDLNYNTRIKSGAIVKAIQKEIQEIRDEIKMLREDIARVDEYQARAKELKEAMENLHRKIPYQIADFFDIRTYATYC